MTSALLAKIPGFSASAPEIRAILGHAPRIVQLPRVGQRIGLRIRGEHRVNLPLFPAMILPRLVLFGHGERDAEDGGVLP